MIPYPCSGPGALPHRVCVDVSLPHEGILPLLSRSTAKARAVVSQLDAIPGIGKKRRTELIKRFGSTEGISRASEDELAASSGMNRLIAGGVFRHFYMGAEGGDR